MVSGQRLLGRDSSWHGSFIGTDARWGEPDLPWVGGDPTSSNRPIIMMSQERRKAFRLPVVLEALWDGSASGWEARITDISSGGCYLDTVGQATPGETVSLRFRLPEGNLLAVQGLVSYVHPHTGFAVAFAQLTSEQQSAIDGLLGQLQP